MSVETIHNQEFYRLHMPPSLKFALLFFATTAIASPPPKAGDLRVATFNISFNSDQLSADGSESNPEALTLALASGEHPNLRKIAAIIQRVNADVILLNEFDLAYRGAEFDEAATRQRVKGFCVKYLEVTQPDGATPVVYPHHFVAPTNTGVHSGHDLNGDGSVKSAHDGSKNDGRAYGGDAFGFGQYPGKYGMVLLSKHPVLTDQVRTFQHFRWVDMPGALLPADPGDINRDGDRENYYNAAIRAVFRLSSKSHWDVPLQVGAEVVHILCSHPTPPSFDDGTTNEHPVKTGKPATKADWNGLRNHDEIRFWADYLSPERSGYIYDDKEWAAVGNHKPQQPSGGLKLGERFLILGDQNADPLDGNSTFNPILQLLNHPLVQPGAAPASAGAAEQVRLTMQNRETKTSRFNLRVDYVLPSKSGFVVRPSGVFWPVKSDPSYHLLQASDHRCVWVDLDL